MGNVSEVQQAKKWIYDKLSANVDIAAAVGTSIFADSVPTPRPARYILYNLMAATDVDGLGTNRLITSALFQVRQVNQGTPDTTARLLDKRIDDVLQVQVSQLSGDFYYSSRRESVVDRAEYDAANVRYHNLGGLYRVWIARVP